MRKLGRAGRVAAWSVAGVLGTGTVAGAVVSGVGIAAATNSGAVQQQATPTPNPPGRWLGPGPGGRLPRLAIGPAGMLGGLPVLPGGRLGTPLYGDVTVNQGGVDHTYRLQIGTLSNVNGSSFTVTSSDHTKYDYTADGNTRIVKNGSTATLAALDGATVRVLAEQTGGRYVARAVLSGQPPRVAARLAAGTLQVAADGKSVTVSGQKFLVDSSTRLIKNGQKATLGQLKGAQVRVFGLKDQSGNLVARLIIAGQQPGRGFRVGPAPWRWQGGGAPSAPGSSASA